MFLVFTVVVDDIEFIKVLGVAFWFDVKLRSFFRTAIFDSYGVKVVHSPVECLLVDLTADRKGPISVVIAYYDRGLPSHKA